MPLNTPNTTERDRERKKKGRVFRELQRAVGCSRRTSGLPERLVELPEGGRCDQRGYGKEDSHGGGLPNCAQGEEGVGFAWISGAAAAA